jgi:Domain of unknown function (DUF4283)
MGPLYIQAHLSQRFPITGFQWIVRAIRNNQYLLDPPNQQWRTTTLEFRSLILGGIRFPIEAYNKEKHDNAGQPPLPVWVKITGLPYRFFKKYEFERIADDLSGSILLDVDPRNSNHHDFSFLRIKIGIADIEVIPPFRKLKFTEGDGSVSFHTLYYNLDHEANMLMEDSLNQDPRQTKVKAFWQKKVNGENNIRPNLNSGTDKIDSSNKQEEQPTSNQGRQTTKALETQQSPKFPKASTIIPDHETIEMEEIPYTEEAIPPINTSQTESSPTNLALIPFSQSPLLPHDQVISPQPINEVEEEADQEILEITPLDQIKPPIVTDQVRQSARIKEKLPIQYITGTPVPAPIQNRIPLLRAGIDSLICDFPYAQFTDDEIVTLFTRCGFSLGTSDNIRLKVVQHFRTLTKQQLSYVLNGILDRLNNKHNIDNIDLSIEVLPLCSIINT